MPASRFRKHAATAPKPKPKSEPKLSRTQAPADLPPEDWQRGLRRQFGRDQAFVLENLGEEPFFSEFRVRNPDSRSRYDVAIRGVQAGDNFCACPDFATNELGTCKHIEFVLARLQKKRGAKAAFASGWRPAFSEIHLRYGGCRTVHLRPGTDCPPALLTAARRIFDEGQQWRLPVERFDQLDRFIGAAAKLGHELRFYDDARDFIAGWRDARHRADRLDEIFPRGAADPRLAKLLEAPLYPYQAEGALFAVRAGRALIGDEMGLGKTIQAIAAMEILARHFAVGRVLIVCPASLKYQWQSEITRFSGRVARVLAGGLAQRRKDYAEDDFCKITNFEKLKPDLESIAAWAPEFVIVDEAQRIKNWNTIAARALKRIDSPYALVLTGTPLENKLEELISIVQFVDQHRLGPTWRLLHEHQTRDEHGRVIGYRGLEKIGETLAPIMIRRRKAEVALQLPSRTDQTVLVPMTEPQMAIHQENAEVVGQIVLRWRRMKFLSEKDQLRLTCALQNMRMACNSTYLLDRETDHGVKADELAALLEELAADPDAKVVVFSQWTRTHDIVIRRLDVLGLGHVSFHGGVSAEKRPALIERFRDDPRCRVFLSTDAGAAGLNLQWASTLVNMDLPWNPAILEQRIGRIHRVGQRQRVRVVNFVAKGSIEEGMQSVLAFKRSLSAGILDGGAGEVSLGGSRLARFMKEVEKVSAGIGEARPVTSAEEMEEAVSFAEESAGIPDASAAVNAAVIGIPGPGLLESGALESGSGDALRTAAIEADHDPRSAPDPSATPDGAPGWAPLIDAGLRLISELSGDAKAGHPWIRHDPDTGTRSLNVPLPPPDVTRRLAEALTALADAMRGTRA